MDVVCMHLLHSSVSSDSETWAENQTLSGQSNPEDTDAGKKQQKI